MIDLILRCQFNIFINTASILPETSTISKLLDLFKDRGFIPSTVHEISSAGQKLRLRMGSVDNMSHVMFMQQKVRI